MRAPTHIAAVAFALQLAGCSGPDFTWELRIQAQQDVSITADVPLQFDGTWYTYRKTFADVSEGLSSSLTIHSYPRSGPPSDWQAHPVCGGSFTAGCGPIVYEHQEIYPGNIRAYCYDDPEADQCALIVSGPPSGATQP